MAAPAGVARTLTLLLDEMHAPAAADALGAEGHDVVAAPATPPLRGMSDEDLLAFATAQQLVIVTENVADFAAIAARWAAEQRAHGGLIFTNPKRINRATVAYPGNLVVVLRDVLRDDLVVMTAARSRGVWRDSGLRRGGVRRGATASHPPPLPRAVRRCHEVSQWRRSIAMA